MQGTGRTFKFEKLRKESLEAAILCQWVREIEAEVRSKSIASSEDVNKPPAFLPLDIKVNAAPLNNRPAVVD